MRKCSFCGQEVIIIKLRDAVMYVYICPNYDSIAPHFPKKKEEPEKKSPKEA